jgi:hypothetical protein
MAMGDGQWAMGKSMTKRFFVVPIASRLLPIAIFYL